MAAVQVYYQESKEETRTETRSSGPNPTTPPAKSNELDSLLSELNSTKYSAKDNNRSSQSSLPRPSVDSLLNELNSVSNGSSRITPNNHINHSQQHSTTSNQATPITASTATRDLDDLMAELSDFKVKEVSIHPAPPPPPSTSASKRLYNSTYKTTTTTTSSSSNNIHNNTINDNNIHSNTNTLSSINANGNNIYSNTNNSNTNTHTNGNNGNSISTTIIDVRNSSVKPTQNDKLRSPALVRKLLNRNDTYAKPEKAKSPSPPQPIIRQVQIPQQQAAPPPPPQVVQQKEPAPPKSNELDCMLGSLANHMTEQGVTTTQKGACCACDKPIVGQVITALGKTWHPEHFTCAHCSHELGSKNFFERDGRPYCEACYHELFSPRCAYCNGSILDKCVTALDKNWHPDHFFCAQCGNTFGEEGFHEKDGKAYCREDYFNMFAPKCGGCNSPIMENYISALNTQWHPECFVCRDCRQPFNGGSFFDHEGMPYCETHYHAKRGSLCAGCHKPITGRCITAMFRKYHPEHFTCSFCLRQLNKGTFKEQNDKPYCHGCFDKLFS